MENLFNNNLQFIKRIKIKIDDIAELMKDSSQSNPDLTGGKAGELFFLVYYSFYKEDEVYLNKVTTLLSEIFEKIESGFNYPTFAGGLAGIGWIVEFLVENDFIDADTDEIIGNLDDFLYPLMLDYVRKGNFDYLHGAVGLGMYFLKRQSNKDSQKYLIELVNELNKIAIKDECGVRWLSDLDLEKNLKRFNLSLSHGLASIIAFLSKLYKQGIAKEIVLELLNGSVKYLLNQQLDISIFRSNFPSWIHEKESSTNSRLAWCYGDLGIGMSLWLAGNNTNNEEFKSTAIKILLHSTERKNLSENGVVDAGLCHGTAGIAHIYNRMYGYTKNEEFKKAALYWFEETLKMAKFDDGLVGYKVWRTPEHGGWQNEYGFLEGIAGIGLSLMSGVSDIKPKWDECLLLS